MANQIIYFRDELHEKLRKENNMSSLINKLLQDHYLKNNLNTVKKKQDKEAQIIRETKDNMRAEEEGKRIREFLDNHDPDEYKKGLKEGKWRGIVEFARIRLGLEYDETEKNE